MERALGLRLVLASLRISLRWFLFVAFLPAGRCAFSARRPTRVRVLAFPLWLVSGFTSFLAFTWLSAFDLRLTSVGPPALQLLDLDGNSIGESGAVFVAAALEENRGLVHLDVEGNGETPAGWTTHVGLAQALCCVKTTGVQPLSPQNFCTALALVPGLLEVLSVPVANNKNVIVAYDAKGTAGLTLTDIAAMVFAQWWPTTFHPDRTRAPAPPQRPSVLSVWRSSVPTAHEPCPPPAS